MTGELTGESRPDGQLRAELLAFLADAPVALIRALDYLDVFADEHSQRAVADRRSTAASNVSETFARLERALDLSSTRDLRAMVIAGEADEFMDAARDVLAAAERLMVARNSLRQRSTILVGAYNSQVKNLVADAIRRFAGTQNETGPRILLPRVMGGFRRVSFGEIRADLMAGQNDYIVASMSEDEVSDSETIFTHKLYGFRLVVVAHDEDELMAQCEVTAADLVQRARDGNLDLLLGPEGFLSRHVAREIFKDEVPRRFRVLMENPDTNTRVSLARAGYGVTIAHDDGIDPTLDGTPRGPFPPLVADPIATSGQVVVAWSGGEAGPDGIAVDQHRAFLRSLEAAAKAKTEARAETTL